MGRRLFAVLLAAGVALVSGCGESDDRSTSTSSPTTSTPTGSAPPGGPITTAEVARGLEDPIQAVPLPDSTTVWVVEQAGRVLQVDGGATTTVFDIRDQVTSGGERGLLSLALHPSFPDDDRVYVHFSDRDGDTQVQEHRVADGLIAPDAVRVLLEEDQPYSNHNGGSLAFGPDGKLYLGLGDGGSANDPEERSQDPGSRLGKLLRLDVEAPNADWEIAAYGLRNPWRFAFDPATGDAWIGDVGQNAREEIDVFPKDSPVLNFGWDVYEGTRRLDEDVATLNESGRLTPPIAEYDHDEGCSVTGGVVVRNGALPDVDGRYVYGDYCSGTIWSIPMTGGEPRKEPITVKDLVSIDAAGDGTVYLTSNGGRLLKLQQG